MFRQSRNEYTRKADAADARSNTVIQQCKNSSNVPASRNPQRARRAGETGAQDNADIGSNSPTTNTVIPAYAKTQHRQQPSPATPRDSRVRENDSARIDGDQLAAASNHSCLCPPNDKPFPHFPLISNTTSTPSHFSFTISEQTSNARRDKRTTKTRSPP